MNYRRGCLQIHFPHFAQRIPVFSLPLRCPLKSQVLYQKWLKRKFPIIWTNISDFIYLQSWWQGMLLSNQTTLYIKTWKRTEDCPLPIGTNTDPHIWAQFCFNELKIASTMLNCIQSFESFSQHQYIFKETGMGKKNQTCESHWISISNSLHKFQMWKQLPLSFLGIELYQRNTNDYKES